MEELDKNRPVQLEDGRQVRNVCFDYRLVGGELGISAIVPSEDDKYDCIGVWYMDGTPYNPVFSNLINVPERVQGWMNIYPYYINGERYRTKKDADENASVDRIACIYITFIIGEGLK